MTEPLADTFRRYRELMKAAIRGGAVGEASDPVDFTPTRAVDTPLLLYYRLIRFKQQYETLSREKFGEVDESLREQCDQLEAAAKFDRLDPVNAWSALALFVAGKIFIRDAWTDLAADFFGRLTRAQDESGRFLPAAPSAHPEAAWFDELTILHAAADYAVQAEDRVIARAVARSTEFISREIEPNHATNQPWALFAFIWNWSTRPLADQLLHAVQMKRDSLDAVSLILLQDALYCVDLFLTP